MHAQEAASRSAWHLATMHYLKCFEQAEQRGDCQCLHFFASRLEECYLKMGLLEKAKEYQVLTQYSRDSFDL
jgi:hypothetical protein